MNTAIDVNAIKLYHIVHVDKLPLIKRHQKRSFFVNF